MVQFFMGFITTDSWGLTQTVATDCSPAAVPNQWLRDSKMCMWAVTNNKGMEYEYIMSLQVRWEGAVEMSVYVNAACTYGI